MSRKVEGGMICLHRVGVGEALRLVAEAGEILLREMVAAELRILEIAARLTDELVNGGGGHAGDLVPDCRNAAREDR